MSAVPMEPNSLPSVPALAVICSLKSLNAAERLLLGSLLHHFPDARAGLVQREIPLRLKIEQHCSIGKRCDERFGNRAVAHYRAASLSV